MRLIDAVALIQNHCGACANKEFCAEESCPYYELRRRIETAPTIEAEPVRHGRWLNRKRNGYAVLVCSECEREKEGYTRTEYCPHCGARMDGGSP